jgi:protocatechuate 3,4-dioxygenase, alpha subunit
MRLTPTASQTVGPFFTIGLGYLCSPASSPASSPITVRGRVIDANGEAVPDAVLELWQANPAGHYETDLSQIPDSGLASGFLRVATDDAGNFSFTTCRPGAIPFDNERMQAPHIVVLFFARGLLRHLITRMYFPDEPANAADPVLQSIEPDRRRTLIARLAASPQSLPDTLQWDVVLQGKDETVFFAW